MSKFRDEPRIRNTSKGTKDRISKHRGEINKMLEQELSLDDDEAELLRHFDDYEDD
jgi:hypothetical protein